jgi:hypothetical protein
VRLVAAIISKEETSPILESPTDEESPEALVEPFDDPNTGMASFITVRCAEPLP